MFRFDMTHEIMGLARIISLHVIFWSNPPSPSSDDVIYEQPLKVSVILEAWKMKFGKDATVLRLVGGIQAMEMQVPVCDKHFQAIAYAAAYFWDDPNRAYHIIYALTCFLERRWWMHSTESFRFRER